MPLLPQLSRLWIPHYLLAGLECERRAHHPCETGGVLLGRHLPDQGVAVEIVIGPGPKARHEPRIFEPDTEWQRRLVAEAYATSARTLSYLGDWHSHTSGNLLASVQDWRAALSIARFPEARCPAPIMLIVGDGQGAQPRLAAYRLLHKLLIPTLVTSEWTGT